mmetsp:Transcript_1584/g.2659  ORF Transcript_1584/g.2659 Transcript_1584/m.2659 type:complete len:213 (-) Transcript_1584:85-723(-)
MVMKRSAGSARVFVRGFDFGTTDEQLAAHMSSVGTIASVKWVSKGAAEVTYSSPEEAASAVETLNQSTIEGNTRFIDVLAREEGEGPPAKKGKGGGKGYGGSFDIMSVLQSALGGGKSWGGKGGGKKSNREPDPAGSGRVFVRGFDFGTDDAQFEGHMGAAGAIHKVHWVTKGSAVVVYQKKASAVKAASQLNQSVIEGNTRYIDVLLKESE